MMTPATETATDSLFRTQKVTGGSQTGRLPSPTFAKRRRMWATRVEVWARPAGMSARGKRTTASATAHGIDTIAENSATGKQRLLAEEVRVAFVALKCGNAHADG
jgi:hypothetical protein